MPAERAGQRPDIRIDKVDDLRAYATVASAFESTRVLDVIRNEGTPELVERVLEKPFRKDYDAIEDPLRWPRDFNTAKWISVSAFDGSHRIGGAICAVDTAGVDILEGRRDLAVVWDLRVAAQARRRSVASSLLAAIERWASDNGCTELKVETQNTNVPACSFYAAAGLVLCEANPGAYPAFPGEVQLIWRKRIFIP